MDTGRLSWAISEISGLSKEIYIKYMDTGTNCKFKNYFPSSIEWFKILVSQRSSQRALNPMIQVPKWPANRYNEGKLKLCIFPGKQKTAHFWHNWEAWKIDTSKLPNFLGPRTRLITNLKMFLLPSFGLLNLEFQVILCALKRIFSTAGALVVITV